MGRFLNQDSYLGDANNPPSLHRYLYAYANPTVYIDPDGHEGLLGAFFGLERRDLSPSENQMLRQVHQTGMKMTAVGGTAVVSAPVLVAGGGEAALLTRATVQGTVQAGRAVVGEVTRYGIKGAILGNPVTTTVVATEATATTAAVVSGADTPVSASEAAVARRIKNTATRMVESSTSIGTKSVPQSMGALSEGSVGAARVPGSHVEQELLTGSGAPEPEVQQFISEFKKKYPGRSYQSGHTRTHSDGREIEIDFETDNAIVEIKGGKGTRLTRQIKDRQDPAVNPDGKVCIGLACGSKGMSKHVKKSVEEAGGLGSGDMQEVIDVIEPD